MDRFGGARYSAYTLRRFYPAMVGENLTFAPSQYSGVEYAGTQRQAASGWDIVSGLTEFATGLGTEWVRGKFEASQSEREIALEERRARIAQLQADADARRAVLTQPTQVPTQMNYLPWVFGGLGLIAAVTVGAIILSQSKSQPASSRTASGRKASSRRASSSSRRK